MSIEVREGAKFVCMLPDWFDPKMGSWTILPDGLIIATHQDYAPHEYDRENKRWNEVEFVIKEEE